MRQDERVPFARALERSRMAAYAPGDYVGQESFMRAREILDLARHARIGPGVRVLDLCCGVAGPGRLITRELGCDYVGLDLSPSAVDLARAGAAADGLACRFEVAEVPPVPSGRYDVVLLLETLLAFPDKGPLLEGVAAALRSGGRFAFTVEEGAPLTRSERERMPDADTVWLTPWPGLMALLAEAGLVVRRRRDLSRPHRAVAAALAARFVADRAEITAEVGERAHDDLVAAHRLWADWLGSGRVRKLAVVAEKTAPRRTTVARSRAG